MPEGSEASSERAAILVVHAEAPARAKLKRILGATGEAIELTGDLDEAIAVVIGRPPQLVIAQDDLLRTPAGAALVEAVADAPDVALLALITTPCEQLECDLITRLKMRHLLAQPMPTHIAELSVAVNKLLRADIFGLEKYLGWSARIIEHTLADAGQRAEVLDRFMSDMKRLQLGERLARHGRTVLDELSSNALFHAPVDASGVRTRAEDDRRAPRLLEAREHVRIRYGCDGSLLGIEVTDQFGSIEPEQIAPFLCKAKRRAPAKISLDGPGAGLGLSMVFRMSSQLVMNIRPGISGQVISLIDLRDPRQLNSPVSSLNMFIQDPGTNHVS